MAKFFWYPVCDVPQCAEWYAVRAVNGAWERDLSDNQPVLKAGQIVESGISDLRSMYPGIQFIRVEYSFDATKHIRGNIYIPEAGK